MSTSQPPPPQVATCYLAGILEPDMLRPFFREGFGEHCGTEPPVIPEETSPGDADAQNKRNELRGIKWDIDSHFVTWICQQLFRVLREDVPPEARTRCVLPCYIDLIRPRKIGGTGPDDIRMQLVVVLGARAGESERSRNLVMTTNERASLENFVDCYNSLIKDEEVRKAVGLDINAIPLMVIPETAIRTPVFDDGMVAELLKELELRKQYCLSMEMLLGDYVSTDALWKLKGTPDQPVSDRDPDSDNDIFWIPL